MARPPASPPPSGSPAPRHRLRPYLEAPLRRPLYVAGPALLGLAAALASTYVLPPRYRASARVRAEWERLEVTAATRPDEASRRLQAVRQRILGRDEIERVLEEAGLDAPGLGAGPRSEQVRAMLESVVVRPAPSGDFFIEYVHGDRAKAVFVANRLARLLVLGTENERARRARADPSALKAKLVEARRAMEEKDAALRRLRQGDPVAPTDESVTAQRDRLDAEERANEIDLSAAQGRAERLRQAIEAESRPEEPAATGPPELARLRAELTELRRRYTEEHPDVEALRRRISRLEATTPPAAAASPDPRLSSLRAELAQVEAEIQGLRIRGAGLEAEKARLARRVGRTPGPRPNLQALTVEYGRAQASYLQLLAEWQNAETASRLPQGPADDFEVVQAARVPDRPHFPDRRLFGLSGLALGLGLGLLSALLAEVKDHSVKGPEDLEEILPHPLLAVLPFIRIPRSGRHD